MQFFTKLAGVTHDGRQLTIRNLYRFGELDAGTQVFLKPEPNNPYDPNAVAVLTADGQHLGYIPKENARQIVTNMRAGMVYRAYVSAVTGGDAGYAYGVNLRIEYENTRSQTSTRPSPGFSDTSPRNASSSYDSSPSIPANRSAAYTRCIDGITYTCNKADFKIRDGVLIKYTGEDTCVLIPDGVVEIGEKAFRGVRFEVQEYDRKDERINPYTNDGFDRVEVSIPTNCSQITHICVCDGVQKIGSSAFAHCENLESVTIPSSVKTIGSSAFCVCEKLKKIKLSEGLSSIEGWAFARCTSLESITLPNSVTKICTGAFEDCWNLLHVDLPNTLTELGENAFCGCTFLGVDGLAIPRGIVQIKRGAFARCANLKHIVIPNGVQFIAAGDNNYLRYFRLGAFEECQRLESVTVPDSVVHIDKDVFKGSPLVTIVASLGSYAEKYARQYGIRFWEDENARKERLEKERQAKENIYLTAINKETLAKTDKDYLKIIEILRPIKDYRDSRTVIKECQGKIRIYRELHGLCLHCGGEFKGLFWKKCSVCNQAKNY